MPSVVICPTPILQFFLNTGAPASGGSVLTQVSGVNAPTYSDAAGTILLPNPIPLNSRGEVSTSAGASSQLFLPANTVYTFTLFDNLGNQIWVAPYLNGVQFTLTQASVGAVLYPQTAAELAAAVTPVNFQYQPGHVDRYGTNTTPGTTPMTAAFQAAINQARHGGVDIIWGETVIYLLDAVLDCTNTSIGLTFRQITTHFSNPSPPGSVLICGLLAAHSAYAVFDLTGCTQFSFYDLSLATKNVIGTYPKVCFLSARNSSQGLFPRYHNTFVQGYFSVAVSYSYGVEDEIYFGNVWLNNATDAGACVAVISANNYFKGSPAFMSSSFTTIVTGNISCLGHTFVGGDYAVQNASATSDVFYLEGFVGHARFTELWTGCSNANGTTHGRSIIYNDPAFLVGGTTSGAAAWTEIRGLQVENFVTQPTYIVAIGASASGTISANNWSLVDCYFNSNTNDVSLNTNIIMNGWRIQNIASFSGVPGLSAPGTVQDSWIDWSSTIVIGTSLRNVIRTAGSSLTVTTHTKDIIIDQFSSISGITLAGGIGLWGNTPAAQLQGWGTPVGGSVISNYNITDAGGANSNTNKAVAELIAVLKSLGLIGA